MAIPSSSISCVGGSRCAPSEEKRALERDGRDSIFGSQGGKAGKMQQASGIIENNFRISSSYSSYKCNTKAGDW